jgi:hypothetical protein
VSCLSFGQNRKTEFPDYFFCHGCDLLEDAVNNGAKRAHRHQKKYLCTGGHIDLSHPSTTKKEYRPIIKMTPSVVTIPGEALTQHHEELQESRSRKDDGLFSTTSAVSSSKMSPCKKKQRRDLEGSTPAIKRSHDQDKGTPESSAIVLPFFVSPSPAVLTHESFIREREELIECIKSLEIKNALLEKKVAELDSSKVNLATQVDILTSQMEGLQFPASRMETRAQYYSSDDDDDNDDNGGRLGPQQQGRRRRIRVENDELSGKLARTINDFVKRSLSNRSKFPTSRIARILIESVLSFEWTHSEFARVSSKQATMRNGIVRDAFGVALTPLLNVVAMKRHSHRSKAALLIECMWDDNFLDGEVKERMINKVRSYLRTHIFTPWKILKSMDLAGFNLSLSGLEVLRRVDVGTGKFVRGILPSKSTMLRTARKLEAAAVSFCPFRMFGRGSTSASEGGGGDAEHEEQEQEVACLEDDTFGEGFEFDYTKVTRTLFEAFGLMDVAKQRPVELGLTSDGAQLTNTISHVAAGLKFNDMAMRHPISKFPLLLHEPGSLVQSRNLCFPLRIVIAKDSKKTLDGFRPLYLKFSTGEIARDLQCRAFKMSFPGDMKLQWGALDAGGAAKVKENFCFACSCRSSSLHMPRDKTACALCRDKEEGDNDDNNTVAMQYCYHYPFLADPQIRMKLADELGNLTASFQVNDEYGAPAYNDPMNRKTMYVRRPNEVMTEGDAFDIDCDTGQSDSLRRRWVRNITDELSKRGMTDRGTLTERHQRLRQRLVSEQRAHDITVLLADSEPKDRAMYLALQGVVCILHLENRVGLKSIESILRSGLSNAKKGILNWTVANGVSRRQEEYIRRITSIMQTAILGTPFAPSQWRFPLTEDGNMGTLSMDNNRTRLVVNAIELLIDASFDHDSTVDKRETLLRCFPHYRAALLILRKDTDATEEEIKMFQDHIDLWFSGWVQVFGKEGCTNYTHMLSSSHVMRYMQEWRCLNRFSQQGWEALNALIKSYFFRRTNRGGLCKNSKNKTKLLGIARWLQRRIMWYSGHGDLLFCDNEDDADDSSYNDDDDEVSSTTTDILDSNGDSNDENYSTIRSMDNAESSDDNDSLMSTSTS